MSIWGAWLAKSVELVTLDLRVVLRLLKNKIFNKM